MPINKIQAVLKSMRPPFLILTLACVFLGFCAALESLDKVNYNDLVLVLLGAVSAHISVNTFNEYFDFRSGLDLRTTRTPFSGGSGALMANPEAIHSVLYVAISTISLTILIGFYFTYIYGLSILPIGVFGVLIVLTYTTWINRYPFLCLLAPGLGFGPLMVVGTHFILTGEYSLRSVFVSFIPFFLVNNLLLLNQYPDIQADRSVGRNHFPIAYGLANSTIIYVVFAAASFITIISGVFLELLPKVSYISLIPLSTALVIIPGILKYARNTDKLLPYLGVNVLVAVLTPLCLGVALIINN